MKTEEIHYKRHQRTVIAALLIFFTTIAVIPFIPSTKAVPVKEDLLTKQTRLETAFQTEGFTLEKPKVIIDPYDNSPLTALILFETEKELEVTSTVKGKDLAADIVIQHPKATKHYVPIYGLYAGKNNTVTLEVGNEVVDVDIKTPNLPEDFPEPVDVDYNSLEESEDLYFVTPASKGYTAAYDINGDVRWYLKEKMVWDISQLENKHLLLSTERPINPPYYTTGLYEIDFLGKIYKEYTLPGGYHHDFFEVDEGSFLVASNEFDNEAGTVEDVIVEISRATGLILNKWDLKEVLNMEDGKSENWSEYDWFHNNSVWLDKDTNSIILSGRHQDAVISIDYNTSKLNWIIGDPTNWSEEYQKYFFTPVDENGNELKEKDRDIFDWQWSQHAAMVTPEGYIFILDNGNNKSKIKEEYVPAKDSFTRGVMYDIDTDNMTIKQVWQYGKERGSKFYSPYISDVDYLGENHYIVHSGGIVYVDGEISNKPAGFSANAEKYSTTVEILDDEVVFEMTLPDNYYRVEKLKFENNFELGEPKELGLFGRTKYEYKDNHLTSNHIDEFYNSHKIEFVQEKDRLIMTGNFKKDEKVEVILSKWGTNYHYPTRVSKKPYTALCLDIFTEVQMKDGLEINKYINQTGLSGKYKIYVKINDTIYNTKQTVNFVDN